MKKLIVIFSLIISNLSLAQQYPWTGKCDQAQSVAEMNECMTKS
jgi:hypothetical protein